MKTPLISLLLLMLVVGLNSGHYIYKVEKEDGRSYEVKSSPRGLILVNSRQEVPTLKDIVFHDLFERFYGKEEPLGTERAFTNSHGLPFLEEVDGSYDSMRPGNDEEEEEPEPKPLTDEAVKEAYKSKSYLFDQMRQRNDDISPDLLERKKRQAEIPYLREAPQIPSDSSGQDLFAPPKTYGMNLNPDGGYVWNNLNNPSSLYELGQPSNGYQNPDQYQPLAPEIAEPEVSTSSAAPDIIPSGESPSSPETPDSDSSEDIYVNIKPTEQPSDSDSSEDISVNINKDETQPLENESVPAIETKEAIPEETNASSTENPIVPEDDNLDAIKPAVPVTEEPKPVLEGKAVDIPDDAGQFGSQEAKPIEDIEPAPVHENPEESEEVPAEGSSVAPVEEIDVNTTEGLIGNSGGDQIKMPEAPTLPPLNYDNLPDYVREAISSTVKTPVSDEVLATAQPVDDMPRTYGMNLTSGAGKVWNGLVNPPVSYEVGQPDNQSEEPKETTTAAIFEEPVTGISEKPADPINTETPAIADGTAAPISTTEIPEQRDNPPVEPETELENEENKATTEIPEPASTIGIVETPETTESVKSPDTEADNEDINPSSELPEITNTLAPATEPVPEGIERNTEVPEIISSTVVPEDDGDNQNVDPVTPAAEENPGEESGSGELDEGIVAEPEEEKPDVMSDLLKSEQFWEWLGEWTATYTELLEKHIRKIAIQEICKHSKQGIDMCPLDKPEDSGSIIKDGKIFINGKEIKLNDNLNQLRRVSPNKGNSVDATTIYGNSVGNEKVTNVFIFNPNNAKDIIEGLKPDNDKVNIIIEEQNKEEIKGKSDENAEPVTEIPELDVNEEITEDAGIEDRDGGVPKVEDIEAVTGEPIIVDGGKDAVITEGVKEMENVTEAAELEETTQVADVKEVTTDSSDLRKANEKESPQMY